MGYNDRDQRYDDEQPPRRPSRPRDDAPRNSGPPSRPRDDGYGQRSDPPPRPRSGDTPPRSRANDADFGPRSATPSRRPAGDDYAPRSGTPSRPRSGDTPSRGRSYDGYGDQSATPSRRRDDAGRSGGGARDAMRRVRDSFTGTFESIRTGRRGPEDRAAITPRRPRDEGYGRSAEWDDTPSRGTSDARPPRSVAGQPLPPADLNDRDGASRSLARRLIERRRRVREGGMPPGRRALITTITSVLALLIIVGGGFGVGYAYADTAKYDKAIVQMGLSQDLRSSRIYDRHGTLLYQTLGRNSDHRFYINYCQIPDVVKWATIDAEDHNFWNESIGIDPIGILRAATSNLSSGSTQGGSTITQQLVKLSVLNDPKQNITRKIDEAILAVNVARMYTRQDVLTMYLNTVPYDFNNDGIEAAARAYFQLKPVEIDLGKLSDPKYQKYQQYVTQYQQCAKDQGIRIENNTIELSAAWQLAPWQATLLVGVPNSPTAYNPYLHPVASTERQRDGVLIQMEKYGHQDLLTCPDAQGVVGPCGRDKLHDYTLSQIYFPDQPIPPGVTVVKGYQRHIFANQYEGTNGSPELAPYFVEYVIQQLSAYFVTGREGFATAGWNVYTTLDYGANTVSDDKLDRTYFDLTTGKLKAKNYDPKKEGSDWLQDVGIQQYADFVTRRNITRNFPNFWYCSFENPIPGTERDASLNPFASGNTGSCTVGPLNNPYHNVYDGALTAIDPRNGDVLAMVGGVDYYGKGNQAKDGAAFNVTTSTVRSMGSSFKPVVYATALEMGWTPGTIVRDQPTCFPVGGTINTAQARPADKVLCPNNYLPHNYEDTKWAGPQPLRYMLSNSLNTPAELALSFVGMRADSTSNVSPLIPMAQRLGIHTLNPRDIGPSAALGTLPVSLLELTSAYGTFANYGKHMNPRFVLQVTQPDGSPIYDKKGAVLFPYVAQPAGYQAISPQTAYMLTSMLTDNNARVGNFGIDNPLHFPGRDVAAKTGTSDSVRDIVTMGYTPWLSLGVWDGNANNDPMQKVIGITGAAYIFHDVMAYAIDRLGMPGQSASFKSSPAPGGYFAVPPGIHRAVLNCHTGLAPWNGQDVTKDVCDPSTKDVVPAAISTEFDNCAYLHPGKPPVPNPNQTEKCSQNSKGLSGAKADAVNKSWDSWWCISWGCSEQGANDIGQDVVWIPDNQDPTVP